MDMNFNNFYKIFFMSHLTHLSVRARLLFLVVVVLNPLVSVTVLHRTQYKLTIINNTIFIQYERE